MEWLCLTQLPISPEAVRQTKHWHYFNSNQATAAVCFPALSYAPWPWWLCTAQMMELGQFGSNAFRLWASDGDVGGGKAAGLGLAFFPHGLLACLNTPASIFPKVKWKGGLRLTENSALHIRWKDRSYCPGPTTARRHGKGVRMTPKSICSLKLFMFLISDTKIIQHKNNQHRDHSFLIVKWRSADIMKKAGTTCVYTCAHLHTHPDSNLNYNSVNCTVSNKVTAD